VTSPVVVVHSDELHAHGARTTNRATDFLSNLGGVATDGWPSQGAVNDGQESAKRAGQAMHDRQAERGAAVTAAANGYDGTDQQSASLIKGVANSQVEQFDMAKYMQGIGALEGPVASLLSGMLSPLGSLAQAAEVPLTAGASALQGTLSAAGQIAARQTPEAPRLPLDSLSGPGSGGGSTPAGGSATSPSGGTVAPSSPPSLNPYERLEDDHKHVVLASDHAPVPGVGGMGMGGMPMGRSIEGGSGTTAKTAKYRIVGAGEPVIKVPVDDPEPQLEPVSTPAPEIRGI
jgi:hypothetical protein